MTSTSEAPTPSQVYASTGEETTEAELTTETTVTTQGVLTTVGEGVTSVGNATERVVATTQRGAGGAGRSSTHRPLSTSLSEGTWVPTGNVSVVSTVGTVWGGAVTPSATPGVRFIPATRGTGIDWTSNGMTAVLVVAVAGTFIMCVFLAAGFMHCYR